MAGVPFHYVDLRTFAYPTEDDDAVAGALETVIPAETPIDRTPSESHHGAPILVLSARVETAEDVRASLDRLRELPDDEYDRVLAELDERIDEDCTLYLSLSKQAAAEGELRLGEGITLRAKVEAYPANQPAAVENARDELAQR